MTHPATQPRLNPIDRPKTQGQGMTPGYKSRRRLIPQSKGIGDKISTASRGTHSPLTDTATTTRQDETGAPYYLHQDARTSASDLSTLRVQIPGTTSSHTRVRERDEVTTGGGVVSASCVLRALRDIGRYGAANPTGRLLQARAAKLLTMTLQSKVTRSHLATHREQNAPAATPYSHFVRQSEVAV